MRLSREDVNHALHHLKLETGFRTPYGISLDFGDISPDAPEFWTEELWNSYEWNPPQFHDEFTEPDPHASPKPSWGELVRAHAAAVLADARSGALRMASQIATRRIAELYHPDAGRNPMKEFQVRLSGRDVSEQDRERERLIGISRSLKARIQAATTLDELRQIDELLGDETTWS